MGRHAAAETLSTSRPSDRARLEVAPVTDPRLFDAPLPRALPRGVTQAAVAPARAERQVVRPAVTPPSTARNVVAGAPRAGEITAFQAAPPRTAAATAVAARATTISPLVEAPGLLLQSSRMTDFEPTTRVLPSVQTGSTAASTPPARARTVKLAVCAAALLGGVSGAAVLLPTDSVAKASTPEVPSSVYAKALSLCSPGTLSRAATSHHRRGKPHRIATAAQASAAAAGSGSSLQPGSSTTPSTPSVSSKSPPPDSPSPEPTFVLPAPIGAVSATPTPTPSPQPVTSGGDLRTLVRAHPGALTLGAGAYSFDDFAPVQNSDNYVGVDLRGDLIGDGTDSTVLSMRAHSSTRAGRVPTAKGTTNQLSLLRITDAHTLRDFTLRGTAQGHLYNGLRIGQSTNARISRIKIEAVPGDDDNPPGETFGLNDAHTDGSHYSNVEIDGAGTSAANFASNSSQNVVIENSYFHDSGHSHGATFWQTKNVTVTNTVSSNNYDTGFNFERVSGTVTLKNTTTRNDRLADIRVASDQGSAVVNIIDPVFSGPKLRIMLTPTYFGVKNLQRKSDIHVIVDGKDRTDDVVQWVTHF